MQLRGTCLLVTCAVGIFKTTTYNGSRIKEVMKIPNLKIRKAFSLFLLMRLLYLVCFCVSGEKQIEYNGGALATVIFANENRQEFFYCVIADVTSSRDYLAECFYEDG